MRSAAARAFGTWNTQRHGQAPHVRCVWMLVLGLAAGMMSAKQAAAQLTLELADYAEMPVTARPGGENTMAQLARVNFLRDEPGRERFFVNDLNGPLYILDKETRTFTTYLDLNGTDGRPGLFRRFSFERGLATGLTNVVFDPDYANNGVFYTLHFENPAVGGPTVPRSGVVDGLDLSGYETTQPIPPTPDFDGEVQAEVVLIEWTDRNTANTTFEGTARELMRVEHVVVFHPMGEMTFNPYAEPGDPEWRVMYIGIGDAFTGEMSGDVRLIPQRLDSFLGKIVRIVPDLDEHTATSRVSQNGKYRIPNDNPYSGVEGARGEIWANGVRNPHRMTWYRDPARADSPYLFAFNIGSTMWETVIIVRKGENYGYPVREGTEARSENNRPEPRPEYDRLPVRISGGTERGTITPTYPVVAYKTGMTGDAIAGGLIYSGGSLPALRSKLILGDITTGRIWYADLSEVFAADDRDSETLAPIHEMEWNLRELAEATFQARGGEGEALPGGGRVSGRGRVDLRFAEDDDGEVYVLTKSDGMIRRIVGSK